MFPDSSQYNTSYSITKTWSLNVSQIYDSSNLERMRKGHQHHPSYNQQGYNAISMKGFQIYILDLLPSLTTPTGSNRPTQLQP